MQMNDSTRQTLIRKSQLRKRWGDMPNSTFHDRLARGLIPQPIYPFGESTPYWRLEDIEKIEADQAGTRRHGQSA